MKEIKHAVTKVTLVVFSFFFSLVLLAQEKGTEINVDINKDGDTHSGNWYNQPWVWIVGAAVFILLLVALLRGNRGATRD
jgi:hypothetical protein